MNLVQYPTLSGWRSEHIDLILIKQKITKEGMKSFDLKIGVSSLQLKVKFACSISIAVKYRIIVVM